jgi:hypothetical protein
MIMNTLQLDSAAVELESPCEQRFITCDESLVMVLQLHLLSWLFKQSPFAHHEQAPVSVEPASYHPFPLFIVFSQTFQC